jgi:hypothetical protein
MRTNAERIQDRKKRIEAAQLRIATEQEKITKLKRELEALENLEIKALLKELAVPFDQVTDLLKSLKATNSAGDEVDAQNAERQENQ